MITKKSIELEGELFCLIEEDSEGINVFAEIAGIDIWEWLNKNNNEKIRIKIEVLEQEKKQ